MRLGVFDVGPKTVHPDVVDAHRRGHHTPMTSHETELRRTEHGGAPTGAGSDALVRAAERGRALEIRPWGRGKE